ncbi:MAG: FxLYD domain-containing protein [Phycisphaerae bacterium]|nr:FxLYD domain-containing protein [Phycisphaerae bacterium]
MNMNRLVLVAILAFLMLSGCGWLESAAERGAEKAAGKKIDNSFKGGGVADKTAQAYAKNVTFKLKASRTSKGKVTVSGTVRNNGSKTVTYLKAHISLLNKDGVEVGGRTDLLAHSYPFGDNNTPIYAGGAKLITCPIDNSNWNGGKMRVSVIEIAIK